MEEKMNGEILIVDDEEIIRDITVRLLSREGFKVEIASSAEEALRMLSYKYFDLVVSDLRMPGVGGMELLKKIKDNYKDTGLIIMTGYVSVEDAVKVIKAGAYDYLPKPFDAQELVLMVQRFFEQKNLAWEVTELKEIVVLYEVSKMVSSTLDPGQLFNLILELACKTLDADSGSLMLLDKKTQELKIKSSVGLNKEVVEKTRIRIGERIAGWVAEKEKPLLLVNGLHKDKRFQNLRSRSEIKSSLILPLKTRNELIGVLNLNHITSSFYFTERDLKLGSIFASVMALSIADAEAYQKLKELDKIKTDFLANVSHELRTPLMSMRGALELLLKEKYGELTEKGKKVLEINQKNTDRMIRLVTELLDFTKMESGSFVIKKNKTSLEALVRETMEEVEKLAGRKNIILQSSFNFPAGEIEIDRDRIKQVLYNLLDNAIKFTPESGRVKVEVRGQDRSVLVEVTDNGPGISPSEQDRIFERFYQVDGSITRQHQGIGLGLNIVQKIIHLHGGKIRVESPPAPENKGSRFSFTLPIGDGP